MHIDITEGLKQVSLAQLPLEVMPSGILIDKLATEVSRLKQKGIVKPFVIVELRDFLPY